MPAALLRAPRAIGIVLVAACLQHGVAHAQSTFQPYASAGYEHNSNLFALPRDYDLGGENRDDSVTRYVAGLDANYLLGRQDFYIGAEGRRMDYDNFTRLDHYEHLLTGGLRWQLGSRLDGTLNYRQERRIAPSTERISDTLTIEHESLGSAEANLRIGSDWRLEGKASSRELQSPQPAFPDFSLREKVSSVGFKYIAISNLAFGVVTEYTDGGFHGANQTTPDYTQRMYGFAADYRIGGRSDVGVAVGRTKRDIDTTSESRSAVTGSLSYMRQLTAKTRVNFAFTRAINSYITAGNSELDTTVSGSVSWDATRKIGVSLEYNRTRSTFDDLTVIDPTSAGRKDRSQAGGLNLQYRPATWFTTRLYWRYVNRDSNVAIYNFSSTVAGLELRARFNGEPTQRPR